jgi:hypothetical protein
MRAYFGDDMNRLRQALGLWKFLSLENWITFALILVTIVWALVDFVFPSSSPLPPYSLQWALSITVVAIAASLIFLQARLRKIDADQPTKAELTAVADLVRTLQGDLSMFADRAEELARRGAPNQIEGPLIGKELDALLGNPDATTWKFRGGSGRWQRDVVLPTLSKIRDREVVYKMLILDPREDHLCALYARYRNTHRHGAPVETAESIRLQLAACIVAAVWASLLSRIKPEIRLSQVYSPMRLDLGDSGAMMTVSDPDQPGLMVSSDSWLYRALDDELERSAERAPLVVVDPRLFESYGPASALDETAVRAVLSAATVRSYATETTEPLFSADQLGELDLANVAAISWA